MAAMGIDAAAPAHDAQDDPLGALRARYVDLLVEGHAAGARAVVEHATTIAPIASVYLDVVHPALYEIGRRWERDEIGIAEEHLATSVTEIVLADLAGRLPRAPRRNHTVIVACGPDELHAVGSRMVADFLEADGWDTLHLGATTPAGALAELAVARRADVVAISVSMAQNVPPVAAAVAQLRALPFPPTVALGGRAFADPELARGAGADVVAASPPQLAERLAARYPRPAGDENRIHGPPPPDPASL
jgi:methanogenic corrinoid protein MtbC1